MALHAVCAELNVRSSVRVLTGALDPSEASHALNSRFIPYLKTTEQFESLPLRPGAPEQMFQRRKLPAGSGSATLGRSAGSTMTAPSRRRISIASAIAPVWSSVRPPRGVVSPGGVALSE